MIFKPPAGCKCDWISSTVRVSNFNCQIHVFDPDNYIVSDGPSKDINARHAALFSMLRNEIEILLTKINDDPGEWSLNKLFDRLVAIHEEYSTLDPVPPGEGSPS